MIFLYLIGFLSVVQGLPAPDTEITIIARLQPPVAPATSIKEDLKRHNRAQPQIVHSRSSDSLTKKRGEQENLMDQFTHELSANPQVHKEPPPHLNTTTNEQKIQMLTEGSTSQHVPSQHVSTTVVPTTVQPTQSNTSNTSNEDVLPPGKQKVVLVKLNVAQCPHISDITAASQAISTGLRKAEDMKSGLGVVLDAASNSLSSVIACLGKILTDVGGQFNLLPAGSVETVSLDEAVNNANVESNNQTHLA